MGNTSVQYEKIFAGTETALKKKKKAESEVIQDDSQNGPIQPHPFFTADVHSDVSTSEL